MASVEIALARTLKSLREARGYSQTAVAQGLGTKTASVSRWESGERTPSPSTVSSLAVLYGTSLPAIYSQVDVVAKQQVSSALREKARELEQQINRKEPQHGNGN